MSQIWAFYRRIQAGDLIVLPLKTQSAIAIGEATGGYKYRTDLPFETTHTRPVNWLKKDIPRTAFSQDLLHSLGAFMTVCQIQRNNAEARIREILKTGKDTFLPKVPGTTEKDETTSESIDIEEAAHDEIVRYIGQNFKGHELSRLVNELLKARGYQTHLSPAGPDGGVDIIAGKGAMGFDPPRLCVQVKSSDSPVDIKTVRELQGVLKKHNAEQGLFVSWGGFKESLIKGSRELFFEIRLWDAGNLIDALLQDYEKFADDVRAELPLKRIWTLVQEE